MMDIQALTPLELFEYLNGDQSVYLIDVRTLEEYQTSHIASAMHRPLSMLDVNASEWVEHQDQLWIMYCRLGKRSYQAAQLLHQAYPDRLLYHLEGGIEAWQSDGYAVVIPKLNGG